MKPESPGQKYCSIITKGDKTTVRCTECDWNNTYDDGTVAQRMASNHIVKKHPDIAKPASASEPKRAYTPRKTKSALGVSFCPCCGTNINAVRVALSL